MFYVTSGIVRSKWSISCVVNGLFFLISLYVSDKEHVIWTQIAESGIKYS
jgi:hypothetical protein